MLLGRKEVDKKHIEMAFEVHTDDLGTKPANLEVGMHKQATYAQVKSWVLENTGLKVSSLYIAQVKAEYGLIERENYNKSKKVDQKVPLCPAEKKLAIEQALRHFGDIK